MHWCQCPVLQQGEYEPFCIIFCLIELQLGQHPIRHMKSTICDCLIVFSFPQLQITKDKGNQYQRYSTRELLKMGDVLLFEAEMVSGAGNVQYFGLGFAGLPSGPAGTMYAYGGPVAWGHWNWLCSTEKTLPADWASPNFKEFEGTNTLRNFWDLFPRYSRWEDAWYGTAQSGSYSTIKCRYRVGTPSFFSACSLDFADCVTVVTPAMHAICWVCVSLLCFDAFSLQMRQGYTASSQRQPGPVGQVGDC